jgi:hypothetical protein
MQKTFYVCSTGVPSDPQDISVPGLCAVIVDVSDIAPEQIAGPVLDEYHDNVAIACLDDFDICVLDEAGTELHQEEDYIERDLQHLADFAGFLDPSEAPAPVLSYYKEVSNV